MLKASNGKTESVPKLSKPIVIDTLIVVIVAVIVGGFWLFKNSGDNLRVNNHSYKLIVSKTTTERSKGLGGRSSLPQNQGMLFMFSGEDRRCFWMKDMRFPLDIVWFNANKKVVAIAHDVEPNTYPETFCSAKQAKYVIELNAGQADAADIQAGQTLSF